MHFNNLRTLIVDDMASMRLMIKTLLREHGIDNVVEASDGSKAVEALRGNRFQLIICDWDMPKMTGLEFLRHVRAEPDLAEVPFIMLTAVANRDHVKSAIEAGVSDYLTKPFKPHDLLRKIQRVLS